MMHWNGMRHGSAVMQRGKRIRHPEKSLKSRLFFPVCAQAEQRAEKTFPTLVSSETEGVKQEKQDGKTDYNQGIERNRG